MYDLMRLNIRFFLPSGQEICLILELKLCSNNSVSSGNKFVGQTLVNEEEGAMACAVSRGALMDRAVAFYGDVMVVGQVYVYCIHAV